MALFKKKEKKKKESFFQNFVKVHKYNKITPGKVISSRVVCPVESLFPTGIGCKKSFISCYQIVCGAYSENFSIVRLSYTLQWKLAQVCTYKINKQT